jgi:hypothetical protein
VAKHRPYHLDCTSAERCAIDRRALVRWPGLDRHALSRCRHDPDRIARLVARCSSLPSEAIRALLGMPLVSAEDSGAWFG